MAKLYLNGADPRTPLAAPIYADLKGLAPLLIQVGACETLLDDALRLAKVAGAADVRVESSDLAGDGPCVAPVPSRAEGGLERYRSRRRVRPPNAVLTTPRIFCSASSCASGQIV
jgi:acetyl esterase/lipase